MKKEIDFDNWWFKNDNTIKAEVRFSKEAEMIANTIDPDLKVLNLYTDVLEILAKEYKMHLD